MPKAKSASAASTASAASPPLKPLAFRQNEINTILMKLTEVVPDQFSLIKTTIQCEIDTYLQHGTPVDTVKVLDGYDRDVVLKFNPRVGKQSSLNLQKKSTRVACPTGTGTQTDLTA